MKKFLNPEKIKIEVENLAGEKHQLEMRNLSASEFDKVLELTTADPMKAGKSIRSQLGFLFEKEPVFFDLFDFRVLKQVLTYCAEQIQNPTEATPQ